MGDGVTRVLLLSANPRNTDQLRINEEFREIREGLNLSNNRDLFDIKHGGATRAKDLRRLILSYSPHIVHFSGHSSTDGIFLESDSGNYNPVTGYALANLFSLFSETVRCVILNACYSREQAVEIVQHIPYVVGMSTRIRDDSAIQFAIGFYDAIGAGRDIKDSYKFGCNAIQLEGGNSLGGSDRSLILPVSSASDLDKYADIDEADKPILLTRVKEVIQTATQKLPTDAASDIKNNLPDNVEVGEVKIEDKPVATPDKNIDTPKVTPANPPQPAVNEPSRKWLPWTLTGLASLIAASFMFWSYSQKEESDIEVSTQQEQNLEQEETVEQRSLESETASTIEAKGEDETMHKETMAEDDTEVTRDTEEQAAALEKEKSEKQAQIEAEKARKKHLREKEEAIKAREVAKKKRAREKEKKAEKAKLAAQKRIAAAKERAKAAYREKQKREQAKLAETARRQQVEQALMKQLEEQQRVEAARRAWQAKQDEIARKQAVKKRWEALQRQKAAETQKQPPQQKAPPSIQPAPRPHQKESAADRMVKEVEELWFDNR